MDKRGTVILAITLFVSVIGSLITSKTMADMNRSIALAQEEARPASINITKITVPDCKECFDIESAVVNLKKQNVKIEEEKEVVWNSPEGRELISKLEIKQAPAFVATGEVAKSSLTSYIAGNGEIKNSTFVFNKQTPLLIDTATGKEVGWVTATIITDPTCPKCTDPKKTADILQKSGVKMKITEQLSWTSLSARGLTAKYNITKVPTLVLSSDLGMYPAVVSAWKNYGSVEKGGVYVARSLPLPYRDLKQGRVVGYVDLIYLTDASCAQCHNPAQMQRPILTAGYGVALRSERTVDKASTEGQGLISKLIRQRQSNYRDGREVGRAPPAR